MSGQGRHVGSDRLALLALARRRGAVPDGADEQALAHVVDCAACAAELAHLSAQADHWRAAATAEVDAVFDTSMLEAQRSRILDRLAQAGRAARVLSFPAPAATAIRAVASPTRRWASGAAAAGLILGLLAGQLVQFMPRPLTSARTTQVATTINDQSGPTFLPASAISVPLSDDELMAEVEAALEMPRAESLHALDALTPTVTDLLALGR